jgi:signal transduction histidine kinase
MAAMATRLRLPVPVQDALLAAFVTLFQIRGTNLVALNQASADLSRPGYLGYILLTLSGGALLLRRRWPVAVFSAVALESLIYYIAHYPDGPGWLALFVSIYTLTAQGDGHRSLQIVAAGIAGLTGAWLVTADLQTLNAAGWVFFRIGTAVLAAALGESVRTRRLIAVEAQKRALLAESSREEEARRRVDAERLRIAREVHDTVAHAIAIINVHAGMTAHVLDRRPEQARATLTTIEQTSALALGELRATLGMLRDFDDGGRAPSPGLGQIDGLVTMARDAGLGVAVSGTADTAVLPSPVDHAAYRIVQEALTNVVRHAKATRVTIGIDQRPDELAIRVEDDGQGGTVAALPEIGGQGLRGMRERCQMLGGVLVAGRQSDGGWRVSVRLPLQPDPSCGPLQQKVKP